MHKIILLSLLLGASGLSAQTRADSVRLDRFYYGSLEKVLDEISTESGVRFVFDRPALARIRIEERPFNKPLLRFLEQVLRPKDLKYLILPDGAVRIMGAYENPETEALTRKPSAKTGAKQKNIHVAGLITDRASGEALPFVSVRVLGEPIGTTANVDGQFTLLHVPTDTNTLIFTYVGYEPVQVFLTPGAPLTELQVTMQSEATLQEVVVTAEKEELLKASEQVSMFKMTPAKLATLPSLGERDIFRSFQLMPGISAANEHTSGLYVRGGTPDQVLTLYDGFTVYNVDHLFGFFSAFNSNSIKDVQLYKGVFDAKYGGRLSSVVEITGKDGNNRRFNAGGDLSLLSANVWIEQPFGEKFTTIVTARRSWKGPLYEKIFDRFSGEAETNNGPFSNRFGNAQVSSYFYDVNAKATWKPNENDVYSLSFYSGADKLDNSITPQLPSGFGGGGGRLNLGITDLTNWGNTGASLKWSRKWSDRLYSNTLASYSSYFSKRDRSSSGTFEMDGETQEIRRGTLENNDLKDFSAKTDWEWKFVPGQQLEFGASATQNDITYTYAQNDTSTLLDRSTAGLTATAYLQDKASFFKEKLVVTPGVRATWFSPAGKMYYEPRANVSYKLNSKLKLKAATGLYYQFAKRVIREDVLSGSRDFWVLTDGDRLPVASSRQYVLGAAWENKNWLFDAETYYKTLNGLTEYSLRFTPSGPGQFNYEENFFNGTGTSRGIDLLLQKKYGRFNGWIGYTLSDTRQHYPVYGSEFYASNDVTHEFKVTGLYHWRKWDFSATWIYASGKPYTAPEGGYQVTLLDGTTQDFLNVSAKNSYRLPDYHRLDIAATYNFLLGKAPSTFGISLFNVYNRANVWYKEFEIINNQVISTDVNYLGMTPNLTLGVKLR
jgi:hypothetical protein